MLLMSSKRTKISKEWGSPWEQINTKRYFRMPNTNRNLITLLLASPAIIILKFCGLAALLLHEQLSRCFNRVVVDSRSDWNVCVLAFLYPSTRANGGYPKQYFTRFGITMCKNKTQARWCLNMPPRKCSSQDVAMRLLRCSWRSVREFICKFFM